MSRRFDRGSAAAALAVHLLREQTGRRHAQLTGRAATGIWAVLRTLGLEQQPIGIPANTCYIVLWAILASGNTPVLLDIDTRTASIRLESLNDLPRLAAIIPTHLYGLPAPMREITEWAAARQVFVIEDAAQAVGCAADGKRAGAWGNVSVFSFGSGKIADIEGGGALLTDDERMAHEVERVMSDLPFWSDHLAGLADQWDQLYWALHQFETHNPRLPALYPQLFDMYKELIAYRLPPSWWSDLPEALRDLPANHRQRAEAAALYDEQLNHAPLRTLPRPEGAFLWRYPLLVPPEQRDHLLRHLWQNRFYEVTRWYPSLRPMLAALMPEADVRPTPAADQLSAAVVCLPVVVERSTAARLSQAVKQFFDQGRAT